METFNLMLPRSNEILPRYAEVGKELHSALSKIGFVSLTKHGIDAATVCSVFDASRKFFEELSNNEKLGYPQTEDKKQGYVSPGKEMLDNLKVRLDHEQSVKFQQKGMGENVGPRLREFRS